MYFYLSLGTNINPQINAVKMVEALSVKFGSVLLFPFVYSKPIGINTKRHFLNSIAVVESQLSAEELKDHLNHIEEDLGRNRQDPLKSMRDRTADIDILACEQEFDIGIFSRFDAPYIHQCLNSQSPKADLSCEGMLPIQRPTTINTQRGSSHIRIIEDRENCFINRLKTAFTFE